jgi:hypothetical protein
MRENQSIEIQKARISAAGAFICIHGFYLFALGTQPYHGRTPVYRLGGHREGDETGWECAVREVYEETGLQISLLAPETTYLLPDGDHPDAELTRIRWQHETEPEHTPLLVVAYRRDEETVLSLMYLAQTDGFPAPSSEVKGLIFLARQELYRLCQEPITLEQYVGNGGKALLNHDFDKSLILEPFTQPRLLSRILLTKEERSKQHLA